MPLSLIRRYSVSAFCDGWAQVPDGWAQMIDGWAQMIDGWAQMIDDWAQARSGPPLATPLYAYGMKFSTVRVWYGLYTRTVRTMPRI